MSDFNNVVISGRLTRDPIARGGGDVAALSLASNRQYQRNGEWAEEVVFVDVTAFGYLAGRCIERYEKADKVIVQGRLDLNVYEAQDGETRRQLRIVASAIQLVEKFVPKGEQPELPTSADVQTEEKVPVGVDATEPSDDDIPF